MTKDSRKFGIIVKIVLLAVPLSVYAPPESDDMANAESDTAFQELRGRSAAAGQHPGAALYDTYCAACHSKRVARAPDKSFLEMLPGDQILAALTDGVMRPMAKGMSVTEREQVADYLGGSLDSVPKVPLRTCEGAAAKFDFSRPPRLPGWGMGLSNQRHIPTQIAKLDANDVPKLELKWAFAIPNANRARSQISYAGGAVHFGSPDGTVYALDAASGCVRWTFRAGAEVRTGITIQSWTEPAAAQKDHPLAFFSDLIAWTYAIDIVTGELKWKVKIDDHPTATATAQPQYYDGLVLQPVSSLEEAAAADPNYECCTFRGSVVVLDAKRGEVLFKHYTVGAEPSVQARASFPGRRFYGPSGAPVWSTPTVDSATQTMYFSTGDNYSSPADHNSDAVIAYSLSQRKRLWTRQVTKGDAWTVSCMSIINDKGNCPLEDGPDVDIGTSPALVELGDEKVLVVGQKSGEAWGINADDGTIRWRNRVGRGGVQGGINFGLAIDNGKALVPVADFDDDELPLADARPGLYAIDIDSGDLLWESPSDNVCEARGDDCDPGISQAITAIPGAVFAGHLDGRLRAYDTTTGKVLWEFDTWRDFETVSGEIGRGGSFSGAAGPLVVDGMVYASSGYGIYFHLPGNVILAFGLPE